jgi:hypothetical protein
MYKINLSATAMKDLWILREFHAEAPIVQQVKMAVEHYLESKRQEIGCDNIGEIQEIRERHELEESKL